VAGEATQALRDAYDVMLAAFEAGRVACRPGALARDVNAACRAPIEEAGLGEHFRHRMGHGIGMDVHERPFLSPEDETPLEAGMTFTDEPSIVVPGSFGMRIENVVVCADEGARVLNDYPNALVCNG
jgi:Xaa-Pro aminopeptidase